jgi:predicted porin
MKKSLFAIAAVTAFAGAAQAQSSVTVYGIMDMGVAGGNVRQATSSAVSNGTGLGSNYRKHYVVPGQGTISQDIPFHISLPPTFPNAIPNN